MINFQIAATTLAALFSIGSCLYSQVDRQPIQNEDAPSLEVSVVNEKDEPISDANVQIRLWSGNWDETKFKGKSDEKNENNMGQFQNCF